MKLSKAITRLKGGSLNCLTNRKMNGVHFILGQTSLPSLISRNELKERSFEDAHSMGSQALVKIRHSGLV